MVSPGLTYFTCTLGEADQYTIERPYQNVISLIDGQAESNSDSPAIGFYMNVTTDSPTFETRVLTFKEVQQSVRYMAVQLSTTLKEYATHRSKTTLGLLMSSSPEFLFTWLGLIQLGHPVLLIAPQCSDLAIAHLCKTCDVPVLFVDDAHEDLGTEACKLSSAKYGPAELRLSGLRVPWPEILKLAVNKDWNLQSPEIKDHDVAYLHHTSGTSSGLPKSILQTHQGAVGVLPALNGAACATFTTTPLYHGGPADIFRAWTSGAMIWLFPSKDIAVTAKNVVKCLQGAKTCPDTKNCPVRYFTSVPYILQMMANDEDGLSWLQKMDMVGVGGAALPAKVGDELVQKDVNLISRFGSAECGFLLSSHRDYKTDKDWQYLRHNPKSTQIRFEEREELHELIVSADWPHMAKRNRDDGAFATADLFEKHTSIDNAWRYHSRADAQITLSTGKKFDPAPIEHDIVAASEDIGDALIFGTGQAYAGVLVFRSQNSADISNEVFCKAVKQVVGQINAQSPPHARISAGMVKIMHFEEHPLEKSSKGTVMRNKAEAKFQSYIDEAYSSGMKQTNKDVPDDELEDAIRELVSNTIGSEISGDEQDLFANGVDSVACIQIRKGLAGLLPADAPELPFTIVEDSVTIPNLVNAVRRLRAGQAIDSKDGGNEIRELVKQYSHLSVKQQTVPIEGANGFENDMPKTVMITGATGFLGSHVLAQLLQDSNVAHIYILIRGSTSHAAEERVRKALETRKLDGADLLKFKATVLQCSLREEQFGLESTSYKQLQIEVDLIMHLAWTVNFLIATRSFKQHFQGLQNLLTLSISSNKAHSPRLIFCSSVAAVSATTSSIPESIIHDSTSAGSTGYARSKLTAELILQKAAISSPALRDRITVIRVGQLSADTQHGIWNASEAYPQILATAKCAGGILPDLGREESLTWLPIDIAAKSFIEASFIDPAKIGNWPTEHVRHKLGGASSEQSNDTSPSDAVKVLHLLNPETGLTFTDFLTKLSQVLTKQGQNPLNIVPASDWLTKLSEINTSKNPQNLLRLLPFWKQVYSSRKPIPQAHKEEITNPFDMHNSLLCMPSLTYWLGQSTPDCNNSLNPSLLDEDYLLKIWNWVNDNVS